MSDAAETEVTNQVEDNQTEQQESPQVSAGEAKARSKGWVSRDEWVESGKDENDWVNFKHFNEKGELIAQARESRRMKEEFDQRISANNDMWKAQLELQKQDLIKQRDEAIDLADKDAVKELDSKIAAVDKQASTLEEPEEPEALAPGQPTPEDIQAENTYFSTLDGRAKQAFAQQLATQFVGMGLSGQSLVDAIDVEMKKEFPNVNPNRQKASMTDTKSRSTGNNSDKPAYSVDSLTAEDKRMLQALKNTNPKYQKMKDSEILKIFNDSKL